MLIETALKMLYDGNESDMYDARGNLTKIGYEALDLLEGKRLVVVEETDLVCPFRKMKETVDDTTYEYYMECCGKKCPFYRRREADDECRRAEDVIYINAMGGHHPIE